MVLPADEFTGQGRLLLKWCYRQQDRSMLHPLWSGMKEEGSRASQDGVLMTGSAGHGPSLQEVR
jgi:hypothetical protein